MAKTLDRMRANPNADWHIADVEKACRETGLQCIPPDGGSHYKIRSPERGLLYVVPAHRRIKPRYIKELVKIIDRIIAND
jgi:predicted RNA binding protein YcfA (HicA-like mRNA interferase family)